MAAGSYRMRNDSISWASYEVLYIRDSADSYYAVLRIRSYDNG